MSEGTPIVWTSLKGYRRVALTKLTKVPQENGFYNWVDMPDGEGWLHCWGSETDNGEHGAVPFTVAIVERDDGSVVTVLPERVRFLDTAR